MPEANEPQPPDWAMRVVINKKLFTSMEFMRIDVSEKKRAFDDATAAQKIARTNHDAAREAFEKAVDRVIKDVHGNPDLPLFANMSDAIEAATSDPIIDSLLRRLVEQNVTHLNILIVAGWTEEERAAVTTWLDSADARKAAETAATERGDAAPELPEVIEMPAFIVPQTDDQPAEPASESPSDEMVAEALASGAIELTAAQISRMTQQQRFDVLTWAYRANHIRTEKGDALVFEDLPSAPSFVLNPDELDLKTQLTAKSTKKPKTPKKRRRNGKGKRS